MYLSRLFALLIRAASRFNSVQELSLTKSIHDMNRFNADKSAKISAFFAQCLK
jgi:hypothetical protein